MSTRTASAVPQPAVSPEVLAFAREQGVEQYLPPLIAWARQVYPEATRFDVLIEEDPEIVNDRHIVFELDVPINVEQAREADRRWHAGMFDLIPAPLICVFRLGVDLRS
jgi:hypothetical protein